MLFDRLAAENFRSIRSAEVELGPLTLLVGANNSGKSSLIRAICALQYQIRDHDPRLGSDRVEVRLRCVGAPPLRLGSGEWAPPLWAGAELLAGGGPVAGELQLSLRRANESGGPDSTAVQRPATEEPENLIFPILASRRAPLHQQQVTAQMSRQVQESDSNLTARVADLAGQTFQEGVRFRELCQRVLGIEVSVISLDHGQILGQRIDRGRVIPLDFMGSGLSAAMSLLVGLAVARNKLFVVEEPENELHPQALKRLLSAVIDSSQRDNNQFVITTHSNIVLRQMASIDSTRVVRVGLTYESTTGVQLPMSLYSQVSTSRERLDLLSELGYDVTDYDLASGWLIVEESSAQLVIGWLVAWFLPALAGLRVVSARGTGRLKDVFQNLREMFLYVHLEDVYRNRAWVLVDGDPSGIEAVERLRADFPTWPEEHFRSLSQPDLELYFPHRFSDQAAEVLAMPDRRARKEAKRELLMRIRAWVEREPEEARAEFSVSAAELIDKLRVIEGSLA